MRFLVFLTFLMIVISCQKNQPVKNDITTYSLKDIKNSEKRFDVFKEVKVIAISDNPTIRIDENIQVIPVSKKDFLVHGDLTNVAYLIDDEGNLKNQIGNPGEGPNSYKELYDITYLKALKEFHFLASGGEIYRYDLSGSFLSKLKSDIIGFKINHFKNDLLLYSGLENINNNNHGLIAINRNGRVEKKLLNIENTKVVLPIITNSHVFRRDHSNLYFFPNFTNSIYSVTDDSLKIIFNFDFTPFDLPDLSTGDAFSKIMKLRKSEYYYVKDFFPLTKGKFLFVLQHSAMNEDEEIFFYSSVLKDSNIKIPFEKLNIFGPSGYNQENHSVIFTCFGIDFKNIKNILETNGLKIIDNDINPNDEQIILLSFK